MQPEAVDIESVHPLAGDLQRGATDLGLRLSAQNCGRLLTYLDLMSKWNKVYNLTAIRDPAEMLHQHVVDCLAVLTPLQRHTQGRAIRLLDVGSGGGLPGVIIAVMHPEIEVTCVDTVGKKASFVQQVATELRLQNLVSRHARVESLTGVAFDVITSRAFASLEDFTRLTRPLLRASAAPSAAPERAAGIWLAMKGKRPDAEIKALPALIDVFHVEQLDVPGVVGDRCVVWMRPRES